MDLFEYQGKQYFARYDIPVSAGGVAKTVDEAVTVAESAGYPVVVKAQVQVGGRGKAGGIKLAANADEVREHAGNILGMDIKGHVVKILWIEHASDIAEEYYASFTLDRSAKKHLGMLSAEGGVEIETVAEENPDAIAKIWIDPVDGLSEADARAWVEQANLNPDATEGAVDILRKLYTAYTEGDADLCEINPLILKPTGEVHALDAKVTLDENAEFRHADHEALAIETARAGRLELPQPITRRLIEHYAEHGAEIVRFMAADARLREPLVADSPAVAAEVLFAIRAEMAVRLTDIVIRRLGLGDAGHPGAPLLGAAATIAASELGWDQDRMRSEIADVDRFYTP